MALNTSRFVEPLLPVADLAAQPQTPLRSEEPNMTGVVPQAITNEYAAEGVRSFNATTGRSALLQS
jgi:hypothetical protein